MGQNWMYPDENIEKKRKNPLFEKIMETGWSDSFFSTSQCRPPTDIFETEIEFFIIIEIPGISKDDTEIVFDGNRMTISGEKKNRHEQNVLKYHNIERSFGRFEQRYRFKSTAVDGQNISASYDAGVLTVRVPKLGAKQNGSKCRIEIR